MKYLFKFLFSSLLLSIDDAGAGGGGAGAQGGSGDGGQGAAGAGGGTPPPVIDLRTFVDEKGTITKPDEFFKAAGAPHLAKRFTTLEALTKSYVNAERMLSNGNKVAVPTEHSTPEEWDAFYKGIGRPDTPEGYELKAPTNIDGKELPQGLWSEESAKEFAAWAHKQGWSKKQVQEAVLWDARRQLNAHESISTARQQQVDATVKDLEKEWGPKDGAKWKENLALAEKGAATVGLTADVLKTTPELSNNPHFIRAMAKVAAMTTEGKAAGIRGGGGELNADVQGQIRAIMNDRNSPYWHKMHPDHQATVDKMAALHRQLYPDSTT